MSEIRKEQELVEQLADAINKAHERPGGREPILLHMELAAALVPFIRSHTEALILAAYEAAGAWLRNRDTDRKLEPDEYRWLDGLAAHIEGMAPDSARRAMKVREIEARIAGIFIVSSHFNKCGAKGLNKWIEKQVCELYVRRAELEGN